MLRPCVLNSVVRPRISEFFTNETRLDVSLLSFWQKCESEKKTWVSLQPHPKKEELNNHHNSIILFISTNKGHVKTSSIAKRDKKPATNKQKKETSKSTAIPSQFSYMKTFIALSQKQTNKKEKKKTAFFLVPS